MVAFLLLGQTSQKYSVHGAIDPEAFRCRNITRDQIVSKLAFINFLFRKNDFGELNISEAKKSAERNNVETKKKSHKWKASLSR